MSLSLVRLPDPVTTVSDNIERSTLTADEAEALLEPHAQHVLRMNRAVEKVVQDVRMPYVRNPNDLGTIFQAAELAMSQRQLADELAPNLARSEPLAGFAEAVEAATAQERLAETLISAYMPVGEWQGAIQHAASSAATHGAWALLAHIALGCSYPPGSIGWLGAVRTLDAVWGPRRRG